MPSHSCVAHLRVVHRQRHPHRQAFHPFALSVISSPLEIANQRCQLSPQHKQSTHSTLLLSVAPVIANLPFLLSATINVIRIIPLSYLYHVLMLKNLMRTKGAMILSALLQPPTVSFLHSVLLPSPLMTRCMVRNFAILFQWLL